MGSARILDGVPLLLYFVGVVLGVPVSTSSPATQKISPEIGVTTGKSLADSSTPTIESTSGLSEFEDECQFAWQRFLVDFDVHYDHDSERQKRRDIFCANWQKIRDHNLKFDLGVVSFKKGINKWSDLTFEEWKEKQTPKVMPEIASESSKEQQDKVNCQAAWEKFLIDFGAMYKNANETEKRRNVFCANWRAIVEHNVQYEKWAEPFKKDINQWTDHTNEERTSPAPEIPKEETTTSKIDNDDNICQAAWEKFLIDFKPTYQDDTETEKRQNIFCENFKSIHKHNIQYDLGNISFKKGINQWSDLTVEEWKNKQRPALNPEFSKIETTTKISVVKKDDNTCQAAWKKFLIDFGAKYQDETETEKRRTIFCDNWKAIQEHNVQFELGVESFKKGINQWSDLTVEEWKTKQRPNLAPEFSKEETTTKISKEKKYKKNVF
ncbi:uncharacterized protein LOC117135494 [Drosophila mauritiana]|uniref:Uncharacterized protein LOC117135494 n=1 Tax=Drosophila mauritiana TaxID=7226 RepID=A0A6P8JJK8_DROMA|nr:uncharacterized protein LOC117135494 [Drosophila mauritiana]